MAQNATRPRGANPGPQEPIHALPGYQAPVCFAKAALVAVAIRLPASLWPAAGRLIRRAWPGFGAA